MGIKGVIAELRSGRASTRCKDLISVLKELGFDVKKGTRGNHYTFTHSGLPDFHVASFDCGHNKHMKPVYVDKVRKVIAKYEDELEQLLEN